MSTMLFDSIRKKRPNVKNNTINSYIGYIHKLYTRYSNSSDPPTSYEWLSNSTKVKEKVDMYKAHTTRKNIYNAIVVALDALGDDRALINKYAQFRDGEHKHYEHMVQNHEKSDKQKENWIELKDIDEILKRLRRRANEVYNNKKVYNAKYDYPALQNYITLLVYRNMPMRNDIANMRVITPNEYNNLDKSERDAHNFLVGGSRTPYYFQINQYKTKKSFGQKKIDIPPKVAKEIRRWLTVNKSGFFITDTTKIKPITANGITKLLTKLFQEHTGKNISTSMIRHIYLSNKYKKDIEEHKEKKEDSHVMGHNLEQQMDYVKR